MLGKLSMNACTCMCTGMSMLGINTGRDGYSVVNLVSAMQRVGQLVHRLPGNKINLPTLFTHHCYNYYSNGPDGSGHTVYRAKGAETGTTSKAPKLHVTCYVHIQHSRVADKETSCMSQDHCPGNGQ